MFSTALLGASSWDFHWRRVLKSPNEGKRSGIYPLPNIDGPNGLEIICLEHDDKNDVKNDAATPALIKMLAPLALLLLGLLLKL